MSTLHVYCDESGGADQANDAFLVAAVALSPHDAVRLIKSFRKAARFPRSEEVKGHLLGLEQRRVLFELLDRQADALSIAVVAQRCELVGGWGLASLSEPELYGHLLAEACGRLVSPAATVNVTPDGGRYPKGRLAELRSGLERRLLERCTGRVNVGFADSAALPGVQIADVIANTVYRLHDPSRAPEELEALRAMLRPLQNAGRLMMREVELLGVRPDWIDQQKGRPEAACVGSRRLAVDPA